MATPITLGMFRLEISSMLQIVHQGSLRWPPIQPLLRERAGRDQVQPSKSSKRTKLLACSLSRDGHRRQVQAPSDRLGDRFNRNALFRDRMILGSSSTLFQRQPIEAGSIEHVHRGPAVAPVTDIRRGALLAGYIDQVTHEALLHPVMDLREAYDRRPHPAYNQ